MNVMFFKKNILLISKLDMSFVCLYISGRTYCQPTYESNVIGRYCLTNSVEPDQIIRIWFCTDVTSVSLLEEKLRCPFLKRAYFR